MSATDRPTTILCIDDNETALNVRKLVLEMAGYSVLTAADVELAMQLFAASAVDIVMSDHLLARQNWNRTRCRNEATKAHSPVVILSALMQEPEGMEHADLFIVKGEAPRIWLKKISDLLQQSRCQAPQSEA